MQLYVLVCTWSHEFSGASDEKFDGNKFIHFSHTQEVYFRRTCLSSLCTSNIKCCTYKYSCFFLGRGIPNQLAQGTLRAPVTAEQFPPAHIVAGWYERDLGSTLTTCTTFGQDPFPTEEERNRCQLEIQSEIPDLQHLMNRTVNHDYAPLQDAVLKVIDITRRHVA